MLTDQHIQRQQPGKCKRVDIRCVGRDCGGARTVAMDATPLSGWENFYVIVGSAAGGLTGLTFVVIALIRDSAVRAQPTGLPAFVTPTIVHFGAALLLSAYLSMPHQAVTSLSVGIGGLGLAGLVYGGLIAKGMRRHSAFYTPVREDWIWNAILPICAYGALAVSGVLVWQKPRESLYAVAAASLALLVIGIHNTWDVAVYMTLNREPDKK